MLKKNKVAAVIVAYNDYKALNNCINSLKAQVNYICVVDNSTITEEFYYDKMSIKYLKNNENVGLGKALNIGIKECLKLDIDWILLLDQDSVLDKNMIDQMLHSYQNTENENIAQIVPLVYDNNTNKYLPSLIYEKFSLKKVFNPEYDTYIDFQITSGSLIRKKIFYKIGLMDELFFIDYIDYDYCFKIRNFNYKILLSKDAVLNHSLGEKSSKIGIPFIQHSSTRIFYQARNRIIVMKRYGKKIPFFIFSESRNLVLKFFKIILLEEEKKTKLKNLFKGIYSGIRKNKNF